MKLNPPVNENYCATVVRVRSVIQLEGLDNLVGVPMIGYQALTQKDGVEVGELKILFTAETQLSEEYARLNNLHRHSDRNADESVTGYLEDNRRVKALKLRGHRSSALLMPLGSLDYLGVDWKSLSEGDIFDELDGHPICQKFVGKTRGASVGNAPKVTRVDEKFFPAHFDTSNYFRNQDKLNPSDFITVTQKLHGTSIRIGRVPVKRKLNWLHRVAKKLKVNVSESYYESVCGSRRVIKDPNNPDQQHYYKSDIYTAAAIKLDGLLPAGYVVYGELIGYVEGKTPIQSKFTYNVPDGEAHLYVYRVAQVNPEGVSVDLSWVQVKEFCKAIGAKHVPELWSGFCMNFEVDRFIDTRFADFGYLGALPLSDPKTVDEGVCVRREGLTPTVLKAKSPQFLEHETKMLDQEVVDIEEDQNVAA